MDIGEVRLIDLTKRFDDVEAVAGIDLEIPRGEFFSLLGPSGCGKTTTLRLVAGFEQPTSGSIFLDGVDVAAEPPHKRNVNTVFQSYALFPFLTVAENVAFGLRYRSWARPSRPGGSAPPSSWCSSPATRSAARASSPVASSSGSPWPGPWCCNPAVLLLDEPLGALDAKLRRTLQVELKALQETVGITFLYVTHDQEEALTMSDRLAVMEAGKVAQVGHPRRGLRAAGRCLRRRLPRRVEPDGRHRADGAGADGAVPDPARGLRAVRRSRASTDVHRPGQGGRPTRAGPDRAVRGDGPNRVPAMVERLVFLGSATQVIVRLAHRRDGAGARPEPGWAAPLPAGHRRPGPPAGRRAPGPRRRWPWLAVEDPPPAECTRCPPVQPVGTIRAPRLPTVTGRPLTSRRCWSWPPGGCCPARPGSSTGRRRARAWRR